jgi:hypothetical protein
MVVAKLAQISFQDVEGDGLEEIVLRSSYPAGTRDLEAMSVFDLHGNELTRNLTTAVESVKPSLCSPRFVRVLGSRRDLSDRRGGRRF